MNETHQHTAAYLKEMEIDVWQLSLPDKLQGYEPKTKVFDLPDACQLLFISFDKPQQEEAQLFNNILKSMSLSLEQALWLPPTPSFILGAHKLKWVWFSGDALLFVDGKKHITKQEHISVKESFSQQFANINQLTSIDLALMHQNPQAKRQLWEQIRPHLVK